LASVVALRHDVTQEQNETNREQDFGDVDRRPPADAKQLDDRAAQRPVDCVGQEATNEESGG
jgi:hypothetical protein